MSSHDFIGIGLGPYNLGLACLTAPIADLDGVFLEARTDVSWHPGMMLDGTRLQTPFLADLVTLADPTSPYSFLSYLKESGRMYSFYIRESFYPLRNEYSDYCRWAAAKLPNLRFGARVTAVSFQDGEYVVTAGNEIYRAPRLVLGTGTPPYLPEAVRGLGGDLLHNSAYLDSRSALLSKRSITVVGSGQSAAEIYADLLAGITPGGYRLNWVTRSPRFFPLEYTKLTLEMTSPEYVDYFHALPEQRRYDLEAQQKGLFKGINADLINDIYDTLYAKSIDGPVATRLLTNTALRTASYQDGRYTLGLRHVEQDRDFSLVTEGLVFATGYKYAPPPFLDAIHDRIRWDSHGRFDVGRNYTIDHAGREIFLQNAGTHTHSITSPDLGMGAYRNSWIIREMLGREVYPIEKSIAFQEFGVGVVSLSLSLRPLDIETDAGLLHSWVTHPKAAYWMMLDRTREEVADEYRRIADHPHHDAFLGLRDGRPAFLAERYDPRFVELAGLYDARPGDVGMHFLCAPTSAPMHGFTLAVITTVMAWLFEDPAVERVVVEPDIRNTAVHALNAAVGFTVVCPLRKPEKQALLSTCTRAQFLTRTVVPS